MEDIKLKATPLNEMKILFNKIELSLVKYVKRHTRDNKTIILSKNLLNRLTAIEPSLKDDTIYTYKNTIKEILRKNHPIHKIYSPKEIQEIKIDMKHGTHVDRYEESDFHITVIREERMEQIRTNTHPEFLIDQRFAIYTPFKDFNDSYFEHESFGIEKYIEKTGMHGYVRKYVLAYIRYIEENPKKSTDTIACKYAEDIARDRIEKAVNITLRLIERKKYRDRNEAKINKYHIGVIYCIIKNIAEGSKKELTNFVTGGKSSLPHFKRKENPIAAISIINDGDTTYIFNDDSYIETYIKTDDKIVYAKYTNNYPLRPTIKTIDFNDDQTITIGGEEFNLDENFLNQDQISLIELLTYDDRNITVNTDFRYDKKTFKKLAMGWENDTCISCGDDDIYNYVLEREGLYTGRNNDRC